MIETGTLLQDRYLIEKQIGAGGMGAVYLAIDQRFDNHVAIKETFYKEEELAEAFEREARLLNGLQHPVLPHVSDYFAENNGYFLVMQFIEGEDLSDILKREGAFSVRDVLRWTDSLLDALDYLHTQELPIIHRDIKPHNLKLTKRGDIMLLDFGLAKMKHENTTASLSVFGFSRTYSPLEQIQGTGTDTRSDIFALGATVYHLLTGKSPIDALSRAAAIVNGKPDPIQLANELNTEVPPAIASIINSALALNPEQRFVSAGAMRQALEHAVNTISAAEPVEKNPQPALAAVPALAVPIINSAEQENFPALESFASDVEKVSPPVEENNVLGAPEILHQSEQKNDVLPDSSQYSTLVVEVPEQTSTSAKNQRRLVFGAAAAALIFGLATVLYFFAGGNSPVQQNQNPVVESFPSTETSAETLPVASTETARQTKTKPAVIEKAVEKQNAEEVAVAPSEVTENSKPSSSNPARSSRPSSANQNTDPANDGETRTRIVEEQSSDAADIETVFTGERNANRANKQERRRKQSRIRDDMSEEEVERLQRERKKKNWKRSRRPLPF